MQKHLLSMYESFLGKEHGDYLVVDVKYIPGGKYIDFKCKHCGDVISKRFSRNTKFKDVKKICDCQKKKFQKEKRDNNINNLYVEGYRIPNTRLTILSRYNKGEKYRAYVNCVCDCGNTKEFQLSSLVYKNVKSCGCLKKEIQEKAKSECCKSKTPLYRIWNSMKQRCNNPNADTHERYYHRGIKVCDEWNNNFEEFEKWSYDYGYRPNSGFSIDRINSNGNYEPNNCRWTNVFVQSVNKETPAHIQRKRCNLINIDGIEKTRKDWCDEYNIHEATVRYREKQGMSFEEALKLEKRTEGNHMAHLNLPRSKAKEIENLGKTSSYIEANLLLALNKINRNYYIEAQKGILGYKVDFYEDSTKTIIECDGYDYHKTKEQLYSDCIREREFVKNGYCVIRFSGKEINENPEKCAFEIIDILDRRST